MFRRRLHQYIAVFAHNRGSEISVLNREITTKRKVDLSLIDEIKRRVCERDGFKQDDLELLNFIYLGKGVERMSGRWRHPSRTTERVYNKRPKANTKNLWRMEENLDEYRWAARYICELAARMDLGDIG